MSHEMSVYFLLSYENTVVQFFPYLVSLSQYIEKKLQKLFSLQLKKSNNLFSLLSLKQLQFVLFDLSAVLSRFSRVRLVATPWTVAHQAALSMEFPRQEYWNGLPFPSPGALPDLGIEPASLVSSALAGGFSYHCAPWEASKVINYYFSEENELKLRPAKSQGCQNQILV